MLAIQCTPYPFSGHYRSSRVSLFINRRLTVTPYPPIFLTDGCQPSQVPQSVHLWLQVTSFPLICSRVAAGHPMSPYLFTGGCQYTIVPLSIHWWLPVTQCAPICSLVATGHPMPPLCALVSAGHLMSPYLCTGGCGSPHIPLSVHW